MERRIESVSVREGYDRWASSYDGNGNPLLPLDETFVTPLFGDVEGKDVLELACGTGRHTAKLVAGTVTAMDFSTGMLSVARQRIGDAVTFVEGDLTRPLPFAATSFDLVVCCLALEHVAEMAPVFREVHRVLRPGGAFVASDMHPAMRLRGNQASFEEEGTKILVDGFEHTVASYVMTAQAAGFAIETIGEHKGDASGPPKYLGWPMLVTMRLRK